MLILLPPSEGKFAPSAGSKLRLAALSFAQELKPARSRAQDSAELIGRYCRPAFEIYTGVLYQALDLTTLNSRAFKRAERESPISCIAS